jgi:Uma2 family endonuclease
MATASSENSDLGSDARDYYEVVNGERREIARMRVRAALIASKLGFTLGRFVMERRLGLVVIESLFTLDTEPLHQRRPDVAFVAYNRLPDPIFPPNTDPPAFDAVPNLAVELIGPSELAGELEEKIRHYLEAGVQSVWVVYPIDRTVHVWEGPTTVRVLTETDELNGGDVLPGFRLLVAALFQTSF